MNNNWSKETKGGIRWEDNNFQHNEILIVMLNGKLYLHEEFSNSFFFFLCVCIIQKCVFINNCDDAVQYIFDMTWILAIKNVQNWNFYYFLKLTTVSGMSFKMFWKKRVANTLVKFV